MSRIALSKSAADKLIEDPNLRQRRNSMSDPRVSLLRYFHRSYSTLHDGTVTEHGDGFTLTTIDPADAKETKSIVLKSVAVTDDINILVGGDESIMSGRFTISWSKWKFTYEPDVPS